MRNRLKLFLVSLILALSIFNSNRSNAQTLPNLNEALKTFDSFNDSTKALKLTEIGNSYYLLGDDNSFKTAVQFYDKALQIARASGCVLIELMALNRLAMVYETRGVYLNESLEMLLEGLKKVEKTKSLVARHSFYNLISVIYTKLNRYREAEPFALKALKIADQLTPPEPNKLLPTLNLARIYGRLKQNAEAEKYFLLGEDLCLNAPPLQAHLNDVYRDWSAFCIANQRPEDAVILLDKWRTVLDTNQTAFRLAWIHTQIESQQLLGNWQKATVYWQMESELNRRIDSETAKRQLEEAFARLETQRKEYQILELKSENERQALYLALTITGVLLSTIALVAILFVFRQRKRIYEQKALYTQQSLALREAEAAQLKHKAEMLNAQNELLAADNQLKEERQQQSELEYAFAMEKADLNQKLMEAQLAGAALRLAERKTFAESIFQQLDEIKNAHPSKRIGVIERVQRSMKLDLSQFKGWEEFVEYFEQVNTGFVDRLQQKIEGLTPAEIRLACLIRANRNSKEMADILGLSVDSVHKARYRLKKKLALPDNLDIDAFILSV